jgi:hypothetical protein
LKRHGNASDNTYCKGESKNFNPKSVGTHPNRITGLIKSQFEIKQKPTERNGDGGKENMKTNISGKLYA